MVIEIVDGELYCHDCQRAANTECVKMDHKTEMVNADKNLGPSVVDRETEQGQQPSFRDPDWQQINATIYQLVPNERGELVNRFSFNVQNNNRMLKPGEDEQIASLILHEHNTYVRLLLTSLDLLNDVYNSRASQRFSTIGLSRIKSHIAELQSALSPQSQDNKESK